MRGKVFVCALAVVAAVLTLHTTALERISIGGARPDLLLAIVVYVSLLKGPVYGTAVGFALGVLQDAQSHHALGLNALAKAVTGFAAGHAWEGLAKESPFTQMAVLFGAAFLHNLIFLILYTWAQIGTMPVLMLRLGFPGALYTAILSPILVAVLQRVLHFRMTFNATPGRYR
jgi:rod shape-determining protein MreD